MNFLWVYVFGRHVYMIITLNLITYDALKWT